MNRPSLRPLGAICVLLAGMAAFSPTPARAQDDGLTNVGAPGHWRLVGSPYTLHFNPSPEHEYVWAVGVERQRTDQWLYGLVYFSNSFGQDSGYLYLGQRYAGLLDQPPLFFQWSAGVLYGYKDAYKDKVPLNYKGFSPGLVVSLGWQFDRQIGAQLNLLGNAGLMLQLSYDWH
jgi:hypothetical protein